MSGKLVRLDEPQEPPERMAAFNAGVPAEMMRTLRHLADPFGPGSDLGDAALVESIASSLRECAEDFDDLVDCMVAEQACAALDAFAALLWRAQHELKRRAHQG